MSTSAIRNYVRHAGDNAEFYAERDRKVEARRVELEARQAALRESNPELAAAAAASAGRRRR